MNDETLRKVQLTQLEILKEVDKICKKNDIEYWLEAGTLLGAVRHKGFIPWDDDLDISMLRSDYVKFLAIAQEQLGEKYFLQNWKTDSGYGLTFSKIIKENTVYKQYSNRVSSAREGIFIDIFPFDVYPNRKIKRCIQGIKLQLIKEMILYKSKYDMKTNRKFIRRVLCLPVHWLSYLFKRNYLIKVYEKTITKYNRNDYSQLFSCGAVRYGDHVINKDWVKEKVYLPFEDGEFSCPKEYDKSLTVSYGDYMQLPPEDQRTGHHDIIEVSFGE